MECATRPSHCGAPERFYIIGAGFLFCNYLQFGDFDILFNLLVDRNNTSICKPLRLKFRVFCDGIWVFVTVVMILMTLYRRSVVENDILPTTFNLKNEGLTAWRDPV